MSRPFQAFLFDLNGTMVDDMEFHLDAWFKILTHDLKANLTRNQAKLEMYGKNSELLVRVFGKDRFSAAEMDEISLLKERRYQEAFKPHLRLLPGLMDFLKKSTDKDIKMAIGSAAIRFNIDFVINNLNIRKNFGAIVSAEDVDISKPHPETFLKAAQLLGVSPDKCVVFEDAPKGVEAALNAGMKCVAVTTMHTEEEFQSYPNILFFIEDYKDERLNTLFA